MAFHVIDRWRYIAKLPIFEDIYDLGYQLLDQGNSPSTLGNNVIDLAKDDDRFDLDIYFILVRFMVNQKNIKMNTLKIWPLLDLSNVT